MKINEYQRERLHNSIKAVRAVCDRAEHFITEDDKEPEHVVAAVIHEIVYGVVNFFVETESALMECSRQRSSGEGEENTA